MKNKSTFRKDPKVTSTDSASYGNNQINKEQSDKGSVDDAE